MDIKELYKEYNINYSNNSLDIYNNYSKYSFFDEVVPQLKNVLKNNKDLIILHINIFLKFKNNSKRILWELINKHKNIELKDLLKESKNNKKWFNHFSEKKFNRLFKILERESIYLKHVFKKDLNLYESIEFFLYLNKKYDILFIEWFKENKKLNNNYYNLTKEQILKEMEIFISNLDNPLIKPVNVEYDNITELYSKKMLIDYGLYMNNCLSRYSCSLKSGISRIFIFEVEGYFPIVFEVSKKESLYINEIKTFNNYEVNDETFLKQIYNFLSILNKKHSKCLKNTALTSNDLSLMEQFESFIESEEWNKYNNESLKNKIINK